MKIIVTLSEEVRGKGQSKSSIQENKDISDFIVITTMRKTEQINAIRRK